MLVSVLAAVPVLAQQQPAQPAAGDAQPPRYSVRLDYVLGPHDQIQIKAPQLEEIDQKPFRIDGGGNVDLPLVGRIHAAVMTLQELEVDLVGRLREYIREPQVLVDIVQFRGAPVFVVGLFVHPGIYPSRGHSTLTEMLSSVGPLQPNSSRYITITRHEEYGPIPLPGAIVNPEKKVSTVTISLGSLGQQINPAEDIVLQPND